MFFAYLIGSFVVCFFIEKKKQQTLPLPKLAFCKKYIEFYSLNRHKLFVGEVKLMILDNVAYLKQGKKVVVFKNVCKVQTSKGYFYFSGLGNIKIMVNCEHFFRFFNLDIASPKFDLCKLKEEAKLEIVNNLFNLNSCKLTKRYIYLITNILRICINDYKLEIKQNSYNLPFKLKYKINGCVKTIVVN